MVSCVRFGRHQPHLHHTLSNTPSEARTHHQHSGTAGHSHQRRPAAGPTTWRLAAAGGDLNTPVEETLTAPATTPAAPSCSCRGWWVSCGCNMDYPLGRTYRVPSSIDSNKEHDGEGGGGTGGRTSSLWWWLRDTIIYHSTTTTTHHTPGPGGMVPLCAVILCSFLAVSTCTAAVPNEIHSGIGKKPEPQFGEAIDNVTVAAGREARLSCIVDNLGDFRVGWLKVDSQTILSLQKRVVTHNSRISVTHDEHRTWNLHIRQVQETDNGCYMCQINTPVMKNQVGCIKVHVPPDIINELTSSDATINEGESVHLKCVAEGYPTPEIKWKREDGREIVRKTSGRDVSQSMDSVKGGNLTLDNVSRKQMGAYLCIASNKVPPSVSKRIIVNVNFSPVVKADNQLIGSPLNTNVEIQCHVEAFPKAVNYWERDNGEIILDGRKYGLDEVIDSYRVTMKLVIKNFTKSDAGQYKCISTNSLGKADTSIRLYEIELPTSRATTEHQYHHIYPTTPHSKSVNSLDLRRREGGGQNRQLEGVAGGMGGGGEGATAGLGVEFDKEQSRQRQRQRLEYGEGRPDDGGGGGYLGGGNFVPAGDGHENHSGGATSLTTRWFTRTVLLAPVLVSVRFLVMRKGDSVWWL